MQMNYDIMIIEDEVDLGNVVSEYLKLRGFSVLWFKTAAEALTHYRNNPLSNKLIVIDVRLPDMNGFDLAATITEINQEQAFLFLTAHNEKENRLRGLEIGAIDYISKPFEIDELVLRVGNIVRKFGSSGDRPDEQPGVIAVGDIRYDKDQLLIMLPGDSIHTLTVRESELLDYLIANPNRVVKKKDILIALWGDDDYFNGKSLEVFISRLRSVFKTSKQVSIGNVYGLGYILKVN